MTYLQKVKLMENLGIFLVSNFRVTVSEIFGQFRPTFIKSLIQGHQQKILHLSTDIYLESIRSMRSRYRNV